MASSAVAVASSSSTSGGGGPVGAGGLAAAPSSAGAGAFAAASRSTTSAAGTTSLGNVSYEKFAPRSTAQVSRLSRIAALTAGPTARAATTTTSAVRSSSTLDNNSNGNDSKDEHQAHSNKSKEWLLQAVAPPAVSASEYSYSNNNHHNNAPSHSNQHDALVKETLTTAISQADVLTSQWKHATSLRLALRASLNIAEDISHKHADLIRHSGELSAAADRLQDEEALLSKHAADIGMPLKHYDAVDRLGVAVGVLFKGKTVVRGLAKIKVDHDEFPSVLDEIDQAVEFFGRQCGGKEALEEEMKRRAKDKSGSGLLSGSIEYYRRALALQEAALYLIREAVADRISTTKEQVAAALNIPKQSVAADQLEASLLYTRFHGISSRSNRLLLLVKERWQKTGDTTYSELLQQCRHTYCTAREALLRNTVQVHLDKLQQVHGPAGMTRLAAVFLIRLCTIETSLYVDFFGEKKPEQATKDGANNAASATTANANATISTTTRRNTNASRFDDATYFDAEFQSYLTSLCSSLHTTVRRSLVTLLDLDTLCQIVSVLREERSMASSSPTTLAASRAISAVIQDAQERLIFCAHTALQKEVIRFKPTAADLDYPAKLEKFKKNETPTAESTSESGGGALVDDATVEEQLHAAYISWFPPMRSVLRILSKIFRVVEPVVFEDLALQAVQACTKCLKDGAAHIQKRQGILHADLFLVKHLLILREQLSPFDIELRSVERQLDFSDASKAVARFLANRNRRLFSMSTENALLTLLREGVHVQESSVDSKRDLEEALRTSCNDFIEHTSKSVAKDLLAFVEDCKNMDTKLLLHHKLLHAKNVQSILQKTAEGMEESMATAVQWLGLYLDNPATQSILWKPVCKKITRAVDDIQKWMQLLVSSSSNNGDDKDQNGWDTDSRLAVTDWIGQIEAAIKKVTMSGSSNNNKASTTSQ